MKNNSSVCVAALTLKAVEWDQLSRQMEHDLSVCKAGLTAKAVLFDELYYEMKCKLDPSILI